MAFHGDILSFGVISRCARRFYVELMPGTTSPSGYVRHGMAGPPGRASRAGLRGCAIAGASGTSNDVLGLRFPPHIWRQFAQNRIDRTASGISKVLYVGKFPLCDNSHVQ